MNGAPVRFPTIDERRFKQLEPDFREILTRGGLGHALQSNILNDLRERALAIGLFQDGGADVQVPPEAVPHVEKVAKIAGAMLDRIALRALSEILMLLAVWHVKYAAGSMTEPPPRSGPLEAAVVAPISKPKEGAKIIPLPLSGPDMPPGA